MVRRLAFILVLGWLCLSRLAFANALETPWEASGHFTTPDQMATFLQSLTSSDHWHISVQAVGQTAVERLPVWVVRLTPAGIPRFKVLLLARAHGNEPAATEAALTLLKDIMSDKGELYRNFEFVVLPCLNPEGAARASKEAAQCDGWWGDMGRDNASDVDINRDYLRLSTPEARTAVSEYDTFHPDLVLDLHEYEARPIVAGDGWWRAQYWNLLVGTGRAPWAAPSLRAYCRSVAENSLFPTLLKDGIRAEYYMLPSGSFDSSMHYASNAADYFLVRGTPAFLLESSGSDEGESTAARRIKCHRLAIDTLLREVVAHPEQLQRAVAEAATESSHERKVTLLVTPRKREVKLMGTSGMGFGFDSQIEVNNKVYHTHQVARFEGLDFDVKETAPLPSAFVIQTRDPDYLAVLGLHGVSLLSATHDFTMGNERFPSGTVVARSSGPLVGLLLLKEIEDLTPNHLPARGVVAPAPDNFDIPEGKPVVTRQDCIEAARTVRPASSSSSGE